MLYSVENPRVSSMNAIARPRKSAELSGYARCRTRTTFLSGYFFWAGLRASSQTFSVRNALHVLTVRTFVALNIIYSGTEHLLRRGNISFQTQATRLERTHPRGQYACDRLRRTGEGAGLRHGRSVSYSSMRPSMTRSGRRSVRLRRRWGALRRRCASGCGRLNATKVDAGA